MWLFMRVAVSILVTAITNVIVTVTVLQEVCYKEWSDPLHGKVLERNVVGTSDIFSNTFHIFFPCLLQFQSLKDPIIIGPYDSIAVYADNDAVDFFKKNGFTDDVVLCSRFT